MSAGGGGGIWLEKRRGYIRVLATRLSLWVMTRLPWGVRRSLPAAVGEWRGEVGAGSTPGRRRLGTEGPGRE